MPITSLFISQSHFIHDFLLYFVDKNKGYKERKYKRKSER